MSSVTAPAVGTAPAVDTAPAAAMSPPPRGSWVQPVSTGLLAAVVGFASTFTVVLQGLTRVGASPAQAASGLMVVCVVQGALTVFYSLWTREPINIVWSTPGAALMIATGVPDGGYPAAVGAVLFAGVLIVLAGLWRPFGRAVSAIPRSLAGAMLAGILFGLCLAPVRAMAESPALAAPIVIAWALAWRFARAYAVPVALAVTATVVLVVTKLPADAMAGATPRLAWTPPGFSAVGSLGLPLFIVTMASQNVPGLAVLRANGYRPDIGRVFVGSGLGSILCSLFGGFLLNLAAVTAALCAGPDSHPDPAKRWWSTLVNGGIYLALGLAAGYAAALVNASPPSLIQAVAGLALLNSLAGSLSAALAEPDERLPATVTFLVASSGVAFLGVGAAFWGLLAGGVLMALDRLRPARA